MLLASDVLASVAAGFLAALLRFGTVGLPVNIGHPLFYWQASLLLAAVWAIALAAEGMYDLDRLSWSMGEFSTVVRALALGVLAVITLTFALKTPGVSRYWLLLAWALAVVFVAMGRVLTERVLAWLRARGRGIQRTLIVGTNAEGERIASALRAPTRQGLHPVGCLASPDEASPGLAEHPSVPLLGQARDLSKIVSEHDIEAVIIASSAFDHDEIAAIISDLYGSHIGIHISSGLFEVLTSRVFVREVAGVPLLTVKRSSLSPVSGFAKRAFDLVCAMAIVLVALPVWLLIMLAIKLSSPGPVFYRQMRLGRAGREFGMFKFRSMVDGADAVRERLVSENEADGPLFKIKDDPRVTPLGRWLRKYSIDEFPQLLNVLRGEMSLVGPRPPLPSEAEEYGEYEWRRMRVAPGMTGLWQVSGRSDLSFDEMVRLDLFYIENWSIGFDISLLIRTVPAVILGRGAY